MISTTIGAVLARIRNQLISHRYITASCIVFTVSILQIFYGRWEGDFWQHSAVVRELSTHPFHPRHPLLMVDKPEPFFSPYLVLVALLARFASLTPVSALMAAGVLNILFLLIGVRVFVGSFFEKNKDEVSFYALMLILFLWPRGAWYWSGFIHFQTLSWVLPYPATFALAMTFLILGLYHEALRAFSLVRLLTTGMLTVVVVLTHPTTAMIAFIGILAISVHHYNRQGPRALWTGLSLLVGAILLACLWPYYPFIALIRSNNPEFHAQSRVLYTAVYLVWPSLLLLPVALPVLVARERENRYDALMLMLSASILVYLLGYVTGQYGIGRIISFIAILMQVIIGAGLAQLEKQKVASKSRYTLPIILVFVGVIAMNRGNIHELHKAIWCIQGSRCSYTEYLTLGRYVGQYDVVLSDLGTSGMIPAFAGKVIASSYPVYWIDDNERRKQDLICFFSRGSSLQQKSSILRRYGVDYLWIDKNLVQDPHKYRSMGHTVYENNRYLLIRMRPLAAPVSLLPATENASP